jgi:hypothetical protein
MHNGNYYVIPSKSRMVEYWPAGGEMPAGKELLE